MDRRKALRFRKTEKRVRGSVLARGIFFFMAVCMLPGCAVRTQGTEKIRDETAEGAVSRICRAYGIPVGALAATGVPLRRKFTATPLWNIVVTLYTLAAQRTGKQYMARFSWDKLEVTERSESAQNLVIRPRSNLLTSSTTESIEDMRNSVGIYDKDGNRLTTVQDSQARDLYGLMESHRRGRTPRPRPGSSWRSGA